MLALYIFLTAVGIVGVIGNLIVASVYIHKNEKATSSFFILVLAFSDLIVCSILVPFTIYFEASNFLIDSVFICKAHYFITTTIVPNGCFLMVSIAFDRYFCICKGNNSILTLARAKILLAVIIVTSILLGIIPLLSAKVENISEEVETYMPNGTSIMMVSTPESYSICYIELQSQIGYFSRIIKSVLDIIYVIAIIIITVLYTLIYKSVYVRRKKKRERKHELLMNSVRNGRSINTHELSRYNRRSTKSIIQPQFIKSGSKEGKALSMTATDTKLQIDAIESSTLLIDHERLDNRKRSSSLIIDFSRLMDSSVTNYTNSVNLKLISTKDIRTAFMLFVVTFLYILFFSPSIIATYINLFKADTDVSEHESEPSDYLIIIIYLYYANSALNPMIYCFLNPVFRKDLKKMFFRKFYNKLCGSSSS